MFIASARDVVATTPGVALAFLFGSAARDEPSADLDVAVSFEGPASEAGLRQLEDRLAEIAPTDHEVDVRLLDGATPRFKANVLRDAVLVYARDEKTRIERVARWSSEWSDFEPVWRRMRGALRNRWMRG
jgi:predicted nucleotidyltransferase